MLVNIQKAIESQEDIKKILNHHSDRQSIDIIVRSYVPYQGNAGYSGKYSQEIKDLAIKAAESKKQEIADIIREGMYDLLKIYGSGEGY